MLKLYQFFLRRQKMREIERVKDDIHVFKNLGAFTLIILFVMLTLTAIFTFNAFFYTPGWFAPVALTMIMATASYFLRRWLNNQIALSENRYHWWQILESKTLITNIDPDVPEEARELYSAYNARYELWQAASENFEINKVELLKSKDKLQKLIDENPLGLTPPKP